MTEREAALPRHVLRLEPGFGPADAALLCQRLRSLLDRGIDAVVLDVADLVDPDIATVDSLARLQLTAQRLGGRIWLRTPNPELCRLLLLAGLDDVVGWEPGQPSGC